MPMQNANPQGKGLAPILDSWRQTTANLPVQAKTIDTISHELFTSLFVLASQIKFKPVMGQTYYLYRKQHQFRLSLIHPDQWPDSKSGAFIGSSTLQPDLVWTLELSAEAQQDSLLLEHISQLREEFNQHLKQPPRLVDNLPFYAESLPFYSRLFAAGLAHSLHQSMQQTGIAELNLKQARKRLQNSAIQ